MAFQWQINIDPSGHASPRAVFDPNPLNANARDQIFWTNNDSVPHWPGPKDSNGDVEQTGFFENQIAPDGDVSATFSPTLPTTIVYGCSLHPDEEGRIIVSP